MNCEYEQILSSSSSNESYFPPCDVYPPIDMMNIIYRNYVTTTKSILIVKRSYNTSKIFIILILLIDYSTSFHFIISRASLSLSLSIPLLYINKYKYSLSNLNCRTIKCSNDEDDNDNKNNNNDDDKWGDRYFPDTIPSPPTSNTDTDIDTNIGDDEFHSNLPSFDADEGDRFFPDSLDVITNLEEGEGQVMEDGVVENDGEGGVEGGGNENEYENEYKNENKNENEPSNLPCSIPSVTSPLTLSNLFPSPRSPTLPQQTLDGTATSISYFYLQTRLSLSESSMWSLMFRAGPILGLKTTTLESKITLLESTLHCPTSLVSSIVLKQPTLLQLSTSRLKSRLSYLSYKLGPDYVSVVTSLPSALCYSEANIEGKLDWIDEVTGGRGGEVVVREPRILSVSIEGDGWVEIDEGGEGEEEEVRIWVIIGGEGGKEFTLNTHACYYTAHFKPYLHPPSLRPHSTFPPVLVSANVTAPSSYSLTSPPPP